MLPCWLNWPASPVVLVSTRGTWLMSAANLQLSGWSTEMFLCFILDNNENTHMLSPPPQKSYKHEHEYLLSYSHVEEKQKHWEGKHMVWIHGRVWRSTWETAKSPSLLSHHTGRTVGESWCFGDFVVSPSDGCDALQEREAASCGWLEGELQWVKGTTHEKRQDKPWKETIGRLRPTS